MSVENLAQADVVFLLAQLTDTVGSDRLPSLPETETLATAAGVPGMLVSLIRTAQSTPRGDWRLENARLFDGPVACPPNETAYVRRDKGAILADLCGFYRAFGFAPAGTSGEKPDHLAVELQFTGLLLVLLARARAANHGERATIVRDALRSFATDHLGVWITAFCRTLTETARLPVHHELAGAIASTWTAVLHRNGVDPVSDECGTGPVPARGTPYECGLSAGDPPG